jgi:large subunit ribosomal protein L4
MPKGILLNREGKRIGEADLPDNVFGIEPNSALVHQYVLFHRANCRQGTHKVKDRSEVSGGGRKPWRQKGTGRARVGTIRSPLWRHGGVTFGPEPRDYRQHMPRKMRRLALASVLSSRAKDEQVFILEDIDSQNHRTKELRRILAEAGIDGRKVLVVTSTPERNLVKAGNNLPGVKVTFTGEMNPYQVLSAESLVVTKGALTKIEELFSK